MPSRIDKGRVAQMNESKETRKKGDYSCEILSFVVIVILSALSHFWYIAFAICAGIFLWGLIVLLGKALLAVAKAFSPYGRRLLVRATAELASYDR
jgi:uncharacterized membrane protein YoaK (UPF0700 family)